MKFMVIDLFKGWNGGILFQSHSRQECFDYINAHDKSKLIIMVG